MFVYLPSDQLFLSSGSFVHFRPPAHSALASVVAQMVSFKMSVSSSLHRSVHVFLHQHGRTATEKWRACMCACSQAISSSQKRKQGLPLAKTPLTEIIIISANVMGCFCFFAQQKMKDMFDASEKQTAFAQYGVRIPQNTQCHIFHVTVTVNWRQNCEHEGQVAFGQLCINITVITPLSPSCESGF